MFTLAISQLTKLKAEADKQLETFSSDVSNNAWYALRYSNNAFAQAARSHVADMVIHVLTGEHRIDGKPVDSIDDCISLLMDRIHDSSRNLAQSSDAIISAMTIHENAAAVEIIGVLRTVKEVEGSTQRT
jgi:hypothetical protein